MAVLYRHADPRYPFLWEAGPQPPARWHAADDAPVSYLSSTPDGAWAELLRHEEITDPADLAGLERRLWAVEVPDNVVQQAPATTLPPTVSTGDLSSYPACQADARELRRAGAQALTAPSAALLPGAARGQVVRTGLQEAPDRDGESLVLFGGDWPDMRAWAAVSSGGPTERQLRLVNHYKPAAGVRPRPASGR